MYPSLRILCEDVSSPCGAQIPSFPQAYRNLHDNLPTFRFVAWCHQMSDVISVLKVVSPASSFPMLSHDSRQPEAICRRKNTFHIQQHDFDLLAFYCTSMYSRCFTDSSSFELKGARTQGCPSIPPALPFQNLVQHSPETPVEWSRSCFRQKPVIDPFKWHWEAQICTQIDRSLRIQSPEDSHNPMMRVWLDPQTWCHTGSLDP